MSTYRLNESKVPGYARVLSMVVAETGVVVCTFDGAGSLNPKVREAVDSRAKWMVDVMNEAEAAEAEEFGNEDGPYWSDRDGSLAAWNGR